MQFHKLFDGQLLATSLLSTSSPLILAKDAISLTIGSTGYCLRLLNVAFDNTLRSKLLPAEVKALLVISFPCIFDHFEAGNDVEVIFLIFSKSKVGP
ncbi:hypothetical protein AVEN_210815-1 [Araneus ventricosus]|uniref:Uncharacterized protein n=1 Tax=Araneus ventricosus TaxID=182803 RepID=A0A4Y2CN35_ARAVE|nr:hypothetical protein AVEN_210815-1 [Araneus ventricosus]